jgi:hypothetical protein
METLYKNGERRKREKERKQKEDLVYEGGIWEMQENS